MSYLLSIGLSACSLTLYICMCLWDLLFLTLPATHTHSRTHYIARLASNFLGAGLQVYTTTLALS